MNDRKNTASDDEGGYENDDCVAAIRNSMSPPIITTPPPVEVNQSSSSLLREDRAGTNGRKDVWDDDFAFIDPKHLVSDTSTAHHHSATNLNTYQIGSNAPGNSGNVSSQTKTIESDQASQFKRRRSTGSKMSKRQGPDKSEVYSYVSLEVEWALGRNRQPSKEPKLDSSSEEEDVEIEQPLYQNEHVSIDDLLNEHQRR